MPRIRMIAGPNGSGKSTLQQSLQLNDIPLGHWLNADEVEHLISTEAHFDFRTCELRVDPDDLQRFVAAHALSTQLSRHPPLSVIDNRLLTQPAMAGGYFPAILCDFIRQRWVAEGISFTFETVMSHPSKLALLHEARRGGFRRYLYFVCTDSPIINQERVKSRVEGGGHAVEPDRIEQRYHRALELVFDAVQLCDRAYFFDNSGKQHRLIAEFEDATLLQMSADQPQWFISHVLTKYEARQT